MLGITVCGEFDSLVSEALSLLANELGIVEIVDTHGLTNLVHGLSTHLAGLLSTLLQDIVDLRYVLLKLSSAHTHRLQEFVQHLIQELLTLHVSQSAATIVILHLIEVLIVGQELSEVGIA